MGKIKGIEKVTSIQKVTLRRYNLPIYRNGRKIEQKESFEETLKKYDK